MLTPSPLSLLARLFLPGRSSRGRSVLCRATWLVVALVLSLCALAGWLPGFWTFTVDAEPAAAPAVEGIPEPLAPAGHATEGGDPPARPDAASPAVPGRGGSVGAAHGTQPRRHPAAVAADRAFAASMLHGQPSAGDVLAPLLGAWAADPSDARTNLLLGSSYLRLAARGQGDPHAIAHLVLAEHFLERARELAPEDHRVASFLVPARLALGEIRGAPPEHRQALMAELQAAFEADPAFNSFGLASLGFQAPRGSEPFRRGLEALRSVEALECDDDPTCGNAPGWPHAVEGFVSFYADYELKAGHPENARRLLDELRTRESYAAWPYRGMADERLARFDDHAARFADDDPDNDPTPVVFARGCAACHHGS